MGETADQIEREILKERDALGRNLEELEHRVKSATNWRTQFERHPYTMLGLAFGGGLLISAAVGRTGRRQNVVRRRLVDAAQEERVVDLRSRGTWNSIKVALVGVGAERLRGYLDQFLPGFSEQYRRADTRHA